MKKQEQENVNRIVELALDSFNEEWAATPDYKMPPKVRLNHCQAWTQEFENFIVLRSYDTNVAVYDKRNGILYDILRGVYEYSSTSAQHIAKFRNLCNPVETLTWREV